ncbi:hypothetical protein L1049_015709 [Liquidambar formosana]|uniref:Major facilitator superfamily (MFS) profile domain-containing protein n=1 Tax=Liquidambar formosana TaxID=63359 RepID=A0AAP0S422_LIQFO
MAHQNVENNVVIGQSQQPASYKYPLGSAILASMTSILLGYYIIIMSGAAIFIKDDLKIPNVEAKILVAGVASVFPFAGLTADWIGRRYTMVCAFATFFSGAVLMGFANSYFLLMFGRFIGGVGVCYAFMIAPVYIAEISPASCRGILTSFPEVFINVGILLGYLSNYSFSKLPIHLGWRFMLGAGAIPSVILAVCVLVLPESPRWLLMRGRLGDARQVFDKISNSKAEADSQFADMKAAAEIPENCTDDIFQVPRRAAVWKDLLLHPTPSVRRILISVVFINIFQQSTGIPAILIYGPKIFQKAGINNDTGKQLATVVIEFVKVPCTLVATWGLDRIGRRLLLLVSVAGMIVSLVGLGVGLTIIDHLDQNQKLGTSLCTTTLVFYVAFYSIGMGPITWVYSSEVFPSRLRAQGASMGVFANKLTSGIVSMTFIYLCNGITMGGAFFLLAGISSVAWVFIYMFLPETKCKTLEEMRTLFGLG